MATTIPGKQLFYRAAKAQLLKNLLDREIGLCTEDNCAYHKEGGSLYPVAVGGTADKFESVVHLSDGTSVNLSGVSWAQDDAGNYILTGVGSDSSMVLGVSMKQPEAADIGKIPVAVAAGDVISVVWQESPAADIDPITDEQIDEIMRG